ncbi:MAG: vitamin B12 dependent-methionine synthase activation domain-containing protein [bacterium]
MDILPNSPMVFNPSFDDVTIEWKLIAKSMGYPDTNISEYIIELINFEINKAKQFCKIQTSFVIFEKENYLWDSEKIYIKCIEFNTGRIIASQLKKSEGVIIFTATVGHYFEIETKKYFDMGDSVSGYIVDTIGSELVEKAGDWIENKISKYFSTTSDKRITHRYSPGYCSWNVEEQFKLFSLLPKEITGITLTESALMLPIKSISGVIGYGKDVNRVDYPCKICGMNYCYKRK